MSEDALLDHVPHARALGLELLEAGAEGVRLRLPYDQRWVGNPDTGVLHGGVITTMLDNACGRAVRAHTDALAQAAIATLDLRIDYHAAATPDRPVYAKAQVERQTKHVVFVSAHAYQEIGDAAESKSVARCTATFMLGTPGGPPRQGAA